MRYSILVILFLLSLNVFSQKGQIIGHIKLQDTLLEYKNLTVILRDSIIKGGAHPDTNGYFKIENIKVGSYYLEINKHLSEKNVVDSIRIVSDTTVNLNLSYPLPCKYIYVKGQRPKCLEGHTDHIIPIRYGFPNEKTMAKAKKGKIYLGGCIVSDCDPRFYCTIHKIKL